MWPPAINIVKSTNGQDANTTTGPLLVVGNTATFTYVVTNTGTTSLATVVVRDDNGTSGNTADDFSPTLQSGDTNSNGRLDTTETWTYQATRTVTAGQYTNIASVTANPVDATGADIAGLADVTDSDPSNHLGITTGMNIVKSTNGQDANTATGPMIAVGGTATFTYVVTNTGTVALGTVVVRDDNGTAANTADDFTPTLPERRHQQQRAAGHDRNLDLPGHAHGDRRPVHEHRHRHGQSGRRQRNRHRQCGRRDGHRPQQSLRVHRRHRPAEADQRHRHRDRHRPHLAHRFDGHLHLQRDQYGQRRA